MRLLAVLTEDREVRRYLRGIGEATELPTQAPARAPPYCVSNTPKADGLLDQLQPQRNAKRPLHSLPTL
jgi:hypothetical protein